jgi:hypothetical protein
MQIPQTPWVVLHGQWSALLGAGKCPACKFGNVKSGHYDIVRKENESRLLWLESAGDLDRATSRVHELTSFWPGEFQVMDQDSHQLVAATGACPDSAEAPTEVRPSIETDARKRQIVLAPRMVLRQTTAG